MEPQKFVNHQPQSIQHQSYKVPEGKRPWHYTSKGLDTKMSQGQIYKLIPAGKDDFEKARQFYLRRPVEGYDIGSVDIIHNQNFMYQFELGVTTLNERGNNPAFKANWENENDNYEFRKDVYNIYKNISDPYKDSLFPYIKFLPMWHGTQQSKIDSLCKTGFANLGTTDSGYFGKGIYSCYEPEYAWRVYSKEEVLFLIWNACFSTYPVIDGDMEKLKGKSSHGNHDAHFAPVIAKNPHESNPSVYVPCKKGQKFNYRELVVFQQSLCLPRYIVRLQSNLKKQITPYSSTGLMNQRLIEAANYCYVNFLAKKYKLTDSERYPKEGNVNGHVIQRPNHGLAHTLRKIYYFDPVLAAFKLNGVSKFVHGQTEYSLQKEKENILTAFLFSVVGRESEITHTEDPINYGKFRKVSADAYENYIRTKKNPTQQENELISSGRIKFYKNLVLDPHANTKGIVNRLYLICHNLDLLRCREKKQYDGALDQVRTDLGLDETKTKVKASEIVSQLKQYAFNCIEATGDKNLASGIPRIKELFVKCSVDVITCSNQLEKVKQPEYVSFKQENHTSNNNSNSTGTKTVKKETISDDLAILNRYEKGKSLYAKQRYSEAIAEFRVLKDLGYYKGQHMMGLCYFSGHGVTQDYQRAFEYFQLAAKQKYPDAIYMVGYCLFEGLGCKKDLHLSKSNMESAAKYGSPEAKKALQSSFK